MTNSQIAQLRNQLDRLDLEILSLIDKRAGLAAEIGLNKDKHADQVFSPVREAQVFQNLKTVELRHIKPEVAENVFVEVVSACRAIQRNQRICFLGEKFGWVNDAAFARFGMAEEFSAAENFEDFLAAADNENGSLCFAAFSPQHATEHLLLIESLFSGRLTICEESNFAPEFSVVSNSARDLSEVHELCVTGEVLQLLRKYIVSLSYDLKIKICRSMSEAFESLQSIAPVAAILPTRVAGLNRDLINIKSGLKTDSIGLVKFLALSKSYDNGYVVGGKTTILCATASVNCNFFDVTNTLHNYGIRLCDIHSVRFIGKPWDTVLIVEIMLPENQKDFEDFMQDLEKQCLLVKSCGFYPLFR